MSNILPLLDVQKLDLKGDALKKKRAGIPERDSRAACDVALAAHDAARAEIQLRVDELGKTVRALDAEVSDVTAKAKDSEVRLYSGTVKASKELESLSEEIKLLKARQSELEDGELKLLETGDALDAEFEANATKRAETEAKAAELDAAIAATEAEIDAELAEIDKARSEPVAAIPDAVLAIYEKLRSNTRLAGRAAAQLDKRSCTGCRVELPVMDATRMKAEPWDAVVTCVHCSRVLVR